MVAITMMEAESNEVRVADSYPVLLAGASMFWYVRVLEMALPGAAQVERKFRS